MKKLKTTLEYSNAQQFDEEAISRASKKFSKTEYSSAHWAKHCGHQYHTEARA